jgi:Protein of unknown function (DUF2793)
MTVNHDAVAALPISGSASKTLLRNVNVARFPYVLFDADDSRNITLIDPSTGAITIDVMLFGRVFHYDPTDTTTAHDGTSCLVSADGLRYKLAVGTDVFAYAVINNTTSVPPVSPTLGDAYLVAAGATGAWAGKSNYIASRTNRGWEFVNFSIGRFIYVESVDTYYHKNSGGAWVTGFGNQVTTPNSVPLSAAINFGKRLIVENQTTNAPPGSPTLGIAYIIGPSPTGSWAGNAAKIAICENGSTFTIYTPANGWGAYDKGVSNEYVFSGSAWVSAAGAIVQAGSVFTAAVVATSSGGGSGQANYSAVTPPSRANVNDFDPVKLTYTARATGSRLRFVYRATMAGNVANSTVPFGLNKDSDALALDWVALFVPGSANLKEVVIFEITSADTSSHDYWAVFYHNSTANATINTLDRRLFTVEEFAI